MNRLNRLHAEQQEVCTSIWGQQLRTRGHQTESSFVLQEDRIFIRSHTMPQISSHTRTYKRTHTQTHFQALVHTSTPACAHTRSHTPTLTHIYSQPCAKIHARTHAACIRTHASMYFLVLSLTALVPRVGRFIDTIQGTELAVRPS